MLYIRVVNVTLCQAIMFLSSLFYIMCLDTWISLYSHVAAALLLYVYI